MRLTQRGVEAVKRDRVKLRMYSVAKTLNVALEALQDARASNKAKADDIWRYAKVCRVASVTRPYLEASDEPPRFHDRHRSPKRQP